MINKITKLKIKRKIGIYNSNSFIKDLVKCGLQIGSNCVIYNPKNFKIDLTSLEFIKIGNYVQFTDGVTILGHDYSYSVLINKCGDVLRPQYETIIGNNVFIGMNSIIINGSVIGNNVIIGAGSVVTGVLEDDNVYAGNPAKKICSLEEYRNKLKKRFSKSAYCYLKNKNLSIENYDGIYKLLFSKNQSGIEKINEQISDGKYLGVDRNVVINNVEEYYESLDEIMKDEKKNGKK